MPTRWTAKTWTLVAAVLGSSMVFLDSAVLGVALPAIGRDLPRLFVDTLEGQNYIQYGYLLSLSALLVLAGALSDYYGRRKVFVIGLIGFAGTSLLCAIAPNMEFLIVARLVQGASGAVLVPGSLAILTTNFEGAEQGRAFGVWAAASALAPIIGPFVGGLLVDSPGPYPFKITNERVTVEEAPVTFLKPEHPLLNTPNKITQKDFEGWVQERGLNFTNEWDPKYETVISSHDPGESDKPGGELYAKVGNGVFVYTCYDWFRELPAGVPGAYRLFANIVSAK